MHTKFLVKTSWQGVIIEGKIIDVKIKFIYGGKYE
jgi:hypothetical protein